MKAKKTFNMIILILSGILAKTIDFSFRSYYASRLSPQGMGIFSLVMSAFSVILSLSSAGMGMAVSRLVAIKDGGRPGGEENILKTAIEMVLFMGLLCTLFVFIFAERIAISYLHDERCALGLLCITPASIFMGISYCVKGYFYGKSQIFIPVSSEFLEQAVKITAISYFLNKGLNFSLTYGCAGVLLGLTIGEIFSCIYLLVFYSIKKTKVKCTQNQLLPILRLSLPMMVSAVGGSYLRMTEDIWIVRGFRKFGMDIDKALTEYGIIHGMAMPLLVFPLTLMSSLMAYLIPEITRAEKEGFLSEIVKKVYRVALICSGVLFSVFFLFSKELSVLVYGSDVAERYIKPLSFLIPVMIIDSLSTNMLSGLGEQVRLLKYNILDSALRLSIVFFAIPRFGNSAILMMIFLSNIMTFYLTVSQIIKKAKIKKGILKIRMPKAILLKNNAK